MEQKTVKAFIYRTINNEKLLVDVRNVTNWSMERFYRFSRQMKDAGRDYVIKVTTDRPGVIE
jgi:hypothetical protein